jgi:hypothetical protein
MMLKARLGDVTAKAFVRSVAHAAQAGVDAARHTGDALLAGVRVVDHVLDAPLRLAEKVPLIGGTLHALDPLQKLDRVTAAIQHGDFNALKNIATDDLRLAGSLAAMVPGIGSGLGAAIASGLAILDGGGPLEVALHAAYGAIPIPPGIRNVTDAVLESVLALAHQKSITDVGITAARNAVPPGVPRDVFDTLAQLVLKRVPVRKVAGALVEHYVKQYAPEAPITKGLQDTVAHVTKAAHAAVAPVGGAVTHLGELLPSPARRISAAHR